MRCAYGLQILAAASALWAFRAAPAQAPAAPDLRAWVEQRLTRARTHAREQGLLSDDGSGDTAGPTRTGGQQHGLSVEVMEPSAAWMDPRQCLPRSSVDTAWDLVLLRGQTGSVLLRIGCQHGAESLRVQVQAPPPLGVEVLDVLMMPLRFGGEARERASLLVPHTSGGLRAGRPCWLLLRFRASPQVLSGKYVVSLALRVGQDPAHSLAFRVTVADPLLDPADPWKRGCFTAGVQSDAKLRLMRRYGLNNLSIWHWHPSVYFGTRDTQRRLDRLGRYMSRLTSQGFQGPIPVFLQTSFDRSIERSFGVRYPSPQFRHTYVSLLRMLLSRARRDRWPEIVLVLHDEPTAEAGKLSRWKTQSAWLRDDLPQAKRYGVFYRRGDLRHLPGLCDVWCTNFGGFGPSARRIPGRVIWDAARRDGAELWVYASAVVRMSPVICRYNAGLLPWQWDARRYFLWGDFETVTDLDDFDRTQIPGHALVFTTPTGHVPTLQYEAVRQGVTDLRYLVTLQKAVDRVFRDASTRPAAEPAQAYLRSLRVRLRSLGRDDRQILQNRHQFGQIRREVLAWLERLGG